MDSQHRVDLNVNPDDMASLHKRIEELEQRRTEAEDALEAIRSGAVDALVISTEEGEKIYTLQGAETPYRTMVESLNEGTVTLIEDGTILYCNRRFAEMLGFPLETLIGTLFHQYTLVKDRESFEFLLRRGMKGKSRGEISLLRKDGSHIPAMLSVNSFSANTSPGVCLVVTDLTDRKLAAEMKALAELKTLAEEKLRRALNELKKVNQNLTAEIAEHKHTEEILQTTQQILQTVVDRMPAAVALIRGSDLRLQLVNPAYQAISPGKRLVGHTLNEIWPETGRDFSAICRQVLETGVSYQVTDELNTIRRSPDGPLETAYFSWSLHRIRLPGEGGWGLLNSTWESTNRKVAELALDDTRRKYQDLIESTSDFIWETDNQGRYTYCSPQMETLWGIKPWEMIGRTPFDLMPLEEREQSIAYFMEIIQSAEPFKGLTTTAFNAEGELIYIETSGVPFFDQNGKLMGYRGVTRDISERRLAEELLHQANIELEQRVRERTSELSILNEELNAEITERKNAEKTAKINAQLAEGLAQSVMVLNSSLELEQVLDAILEQLQNSVPYTIAAITKFEDHTIRLVRYKLVENVIDITKTLGLKDLILKYPEQMEIGITQQPYYIENLRTYPELISIPGLEWVRSYLAIPLVIGGQFQGTIHLVSNQQCAFNPQMISSAMSFAGPAATALQNALLYKDLQVAFQKEQTMRLQLIQAEKLSALSRMLATVVHEINNPVQTIKNCVYLARLDTPEKSAAGESLAMAASEADRIGKLVAGLREIYRHPKNIDVEHINLADLIDEVHTMLDPHMQHNKVGWQERYSKDPLWIYGIDDHLKQVFLNIIMNAVEAMQPDGGTITVTTASHPDNHEVSVSIADTGPGINLDDVEKIFEPFYTTKEGGSGLGLPICYEIVQQHKGHITVDSQPGMGATFTIWLPINRQNEEL